MRNLICKEGPLNGQLSPYGPCLGNLEGVRLLRLLREKENAYLGSFFFLGPRGH